MNQGGPTNLKHIGFRHLLKWDEHLLIIWYDIKTSIPAGIWPFLVLASVGIMLQVGIDETEQLLVQAFTAEILFPLLAAMLSYRLILEDMEEQRIEFLMVREPLQSLWMHRLGSLISVATLSLGGMWAGWQIASKETFSLVSTLYVFAAPALVLSGIGSVFAFWVRRVPIGDLVLVFWWGFCILSYKAAYHILGPLYLFPLWYSLRVEETVDVLSAKWTLGGIGLVFLFLGFFVLDKHERNKCST